MITFRSTGKFAYEAVYLLFVLTRPLQQRYQVQLAHSNSLKPPLLQEGEQHLGSLSFGWFEEAKGQTGSFWQLRLGH